MAAAAAGSCGNDVECPGGSNCGPGAPSEVTGPVLEVTSGGLGKVESFVVRDNDRRYEILIDPGEDYDFPLDHLSEHRASGAPVHVVLDRRSGGLVALAIEDA